MVLILIDLQSKITARLLFSLISFLLPINIIAQSPTKTLHKNWQLMDFDQDRVYGTSVVKAYNRLLKGRKGRPVIVAVIDTGLDTAHEDIGPNVWTNKKEIVGNGVDDDRNGYIDDIHGWNFLGGKDGRNLNEESYELYREYYRLRVFYGKLTDSTKIPFNKKTEYRYYISIRQAHVKDSLETVSNLAWITGVLSTHTLVDSIWRIALNKETITIKDIKNAYANGKTAGNNDDSLSKSVINFYNYLPDMVPLKEQLTKHNEYLIFLQKKLQGFSSDPNAARRDIVGDNPFELNDRNYGNNNIAAGIPKHGTMVAGIIAAVPNNDIGIDGITNMALIMPLRAALNGDERDKDVALALRYAVDNGAKIINMSFGKPYSPDKKWVDDAVKYAEQKDVLIIHAAGNDSKNIDSADNFPNPKFLGTTMEAQNYITVGASTGGPDSLIAASFSNYGHKQVNVFAPGENIYSAAPGDNYETSSGSSFSSPIVAGIAALILQYYPALTARQVKYVIEKSITKLHGQAVRVPGSKTKAYFSALCSSGGIVNAYNALELAARLKGKRKINR